MLPDRERIPAFQSLLEIARDMKANNVEPSPEYMCEVYEVVRLGRPQYEMIYPLLDLITTIGDLNLSRNREVLAYWRGIVADGVWMVVTHFDILRDAKTLLAKLYRYIGVEADNLDDHASLEPLARVIESKWNDPEWLLCHIEYRLIVTGRSGYEHEFQIAVDLMRAMHYQDQYLYMLATCLVAEVCFYYQQVNEAFTYGQQTLAIADYLGKPVYKLGAMMCMLPSVLFTDAKHPDKMHNEWVARDIIEYWEREYHKNDWTTPRQEALFFSMTGPYYLIKKEYDLAERNLKKAVQLFQYLEDEVNAIRMQIALAQAMTRLEDYRRAIFWCEEAATAARKSRMHVLVAWALHTHGWVLFKSGQNEEAFQILVYALDEAIHLDESNARQSQMLGIGDELLKVLEHLEYSDKLAALRDDLLRLISDLPPIEWVEKLKAGLQDFGPN